MSDEILFCPHILSLDDIYLLIYKKYLLMLYILFTKNMGLQRPVKIQHC